MSANQHSSSWQNINTREDVQYTQESGRNLLEREGRTDIYRCDRWIVGPFSPISLYDKFAHCSSPNSSAGGSLIVVRTWLRRQSHTLINLITTSYQSTSKPSELDPC